MLDRRLLRRFDFLLIVVIIGLVAAGVAMIYSAARGDPVIQRTPIDQAITAMVGLLLLIILSVVDYTLLRNVAWLMYAVTLASLILVLLIGAERFGGRRWFQLGGFDLQPAEVAKLSLGIVISHFIASREGRHNYLSTVGLSFLLIAPCVGLILRQPNLSSALIILFMWLAMVFVGGIRSQHVLVMSLSGLAMAIIVWQLGLIQPYQIERVQTLLGIGVEPGEDYQSQQALIALAGGGLWGQGYLQGSQTQLRFLPVRHTDFIFSVVGEELGFVGAMVFVLALVFIIMRTLRAAWVSYDTFGRLLCVSVAGVFFLQTYINLGMQVQLLPVTGVVLPFVSYGRSSLISALVAIGLVQSVSVRSKRLEF